jgi:hypothetical protein
MNASPSIAALAAALSKAQGAISGAKRDADNPFFKSKYADLASCWEAIRDPFAKNGLSLVQFPKPGTADPPSVLIETILMHESGEWLADTLEIPVTKNDAQGVGSAITYGRRYGLCAAAGVAPEDDDANAAVGQRKAPEPPKERAKPLPKTGIDGLRAGAFATMQQMVAQGVLGSELLAPTPEGSLAREALRQELLGSGPWDKASEKDWRAWVKALENLREMNRPPDDAA